MACGWGRAAHIALSAPRVCSSAICMRLAVRRQRPSLRAPCQKRLKATRNRARGVLTTDLTMGLLHLTLNLNLFSPVVPDPGRPSSQHTGLAASSPRRPPASRMQISKLSLVPTNKTRPPMKFSLTQHGPAHVSGAPGATKTTSTPQCTCIHFHRRSCRHVPDKRVHARERIRGRLSSDHDGVGLHLVRALFKEVHIPVEIAVWRRRARSPRRVGALVPKVWTLWQGSARRLEALTHVWCASARIGRKLPEGSCHKGITQLWAVQSAGRQPQLAAVLTLDPSASSGCLFSRANRSVVPHFDTPVGNTQQCRQGPLRSIQHTDSNSGAEMSCSSAFKNV
eukprot:366399-Chlamydomonas_euryale.AAC.41